MLLANIVWEVNMALLVVLALLALLALGAGFLIVKWLFIVAAVLALIWLISFFAGGVARAGRRV
jgi:hypothetical protein